ncbi:MAG: BlaI/MecI/CopY family transcriptional regulator [Clostridia bacterium]|nr:BlaI/MecI/CopY family transcriptional regulator [Clostridia bacterium]
MKNIKLFDAELKFMNIIWDNAPINSTELVKKALDELGWKKSTTYTVIRKLCDRGVLQNKNTIVTALVDRKQVQREASQDHLKKMYDGSLKLFLASFLDKEQLTEREALELKELIDKKTEKES